MDVKKRTLEEIINQEIENLGLTKTELAELCGLSTGHFTNISNGKASTRSAYRPEPEFINKLSFHLKVPIEEILESLGYKLSREKKSLPPRLASFVDDFENLSPAVQQHVLKMMSSLMETIHQCEQEITKVLDNQTVSATINGKEFKMRFLEPIEKLNEVLIKDE